MLTNNQKEKLKKIGISYCGEISINLDITLSLLCCAIESVVWKEFIITANYDYISAVNFMELHDSIKLDKALISAALECLGVSQDIDNILDTWRKENN